MRTSRWWVRVGLTALGVAAVVLPACDGDDDAAPEEGEPAPVLDVGTNSATSCLLVDETLPPEVSELPVVPCTDEHTHEVYSVVEYEEKDVYPGMTELEAFAERECLAAFEPFVGISAFDSSLSFSWLVPSLKGWTDEDDRDVLCVLGDPDGGRLTRSMRGSRL